MAQEFNVAACRRQFPGLSRQVGDRPAVFLDGPAGAQVPQLVIDAVVRVFTQCNANDGGLFPTSREVGAMVDQARSAAADLLGADDTGEIIFGPNMTGLTFALSRSLARTWRTGDEIVLTRLDHDANISPWVQAAEEAGATVRYVEIDPATCTLRMDGLAELLNERTRLVAVGIASNAVGTINPIREIVAAVRKVGSLVFLDAVHAAPHLLIDVRELGADFLACSAYKFFGPHVGILWGRRELLEKLRAYKVRPAPDSLPGRWMTGTPNFEGIVGTLAAVDYLADLAGNNSVRRQAIISSFNAIRAHENALSKQFLGGIHRLAGWRVWGIVDPNRLECRVSTFGITHRKHDPSEIASALADQGIFVWHGHFYAVELIQALGLAPQGMVRAGFLHYNTADEVARLLETLARFDA